MAPVLAAKADISANIVVPSPARRGTGSLLVTTPPYGECVSEHSIGPDDRVPASPYLDRASDCLAEIRSQASVLDQTGVGRDVVDRLAAAGFFTAANYSPPAVVRELNELLAASSGSTWFVATQHRAPAETARTTANSRLRERWATSLADGSALGAVSFAHLRRAGPPQVRAVPEGSGWRLTGRLDWITSWGLADVLLLMAESDDGQVVQALIPAHATPGLEITGPLALAAMSGTSTVGAVLSDLRVDGDEVAQVLSKESWAHHDSHRTANASPAVFGLMRACLASLSSVGEARGIPGATHVAEQWAEQIRPIRSRAYTLIDELPPEDCLDERLALRAESLYLLQQATSALLAAVGGRGMLLDADAQRWARESMFMLIQAQTGPLRARLFARYASA
jgi:hypothetical protein